MNKNHGHDAALGWQVFCLHQEAIDITIMFASLANVLEQTDPMLLDRTLDLIETEANDGQQG